MKDFEKIIWRDALTLIDFFSSWCGPCHAMRPDVDKFQQQMIGRVDVYHINIDSPDMQEYVKRYNIHKLPTLIFFRRGEIRWQGSGRTSAGELTAVLNELEKQEHLAQV